MFLRTSIVRSLVGLGILGLLCWLALVADPSAQRMEQINVLIARGEIGKVSPELQRRLEAQFGWLAKHAGVRGTVGVNAPLDKRRLTLLITNPKHVALTSCGAGNAIFDPSLNAILVDVGLVWPEEVNIIGSPSVNSMFTINSYGYITSYINFILAHELGHWARHSASAAFFYYGWNEGAASLHEEKEADAAAAATLIRAHEAGDLPAPLKQLNALAGLGLQAANLTPRQLAIADTLAGVSQMTEDLMFSSSPFSPYYSDANHPNFLDRVSAAVQLFEKSSEIPAIAPQVELVRARLRRFGSLGHWRHRELFLPGPLIVADVREEALWLGRTDIPALGTAVLDEHIYRLPLAELHGSQSRDNLSHLKPVLMGRSKVGEAYGYAEGFGAWVEAQFEHGDSNIGLPPPIESVAPQRERVFGPNKRGGLEYLGMGWRWPSPSGGDEGQVTEKALLEHLQRLMPRSDFGLGRLHLVRSLGVLVPVSKSNANGTEFHVFRVVSAAPLKLVELDGFKFQRSIGVIEIAAVTNWRGVWWIPLRLDTNRTNDRVELWKVRHGDSSLFGKANFVTGEVAGKFSTVFRESLAPRNPSFVPIGTERAVFGYDYDSLFLVDEHSSAFRLLFYPAKPGLRLLQLRDNWILLWTLHARKAYLIDVSSRDDVARQLPLPTPSSKPHPSDTQ